METHVRLPGSKYYRSAAMYQPDQGQTRRTISLVLLLLIVFLIAIATQARAAEKPANYVALKGGVYSPSTSHGLDNFNGGSTTHLDSKPSFGGQHVRLDGFITTADIGFRF